MSDNIVTDTTTSLVVNNVARLEDYGGVSIVNLFSLLTPKLQMRWVRDIDINDLENDKYIKKAAEEASRLAEEEARRQEEEARASALAAEEARILKEQREEELALLRRICASLEDK
jgi:hypothetical protein